MTNIVEDDVPFIERSFNQRVPARSPRTVRGEMFHAAANIADLAAQILAGPAALEALIASLDEAAAAELVEHYKSEADRHWFINANRSLEFAELVIRIGEQRRNLRQIALGTMARGDALKLLGRLQEAWDELERAGRMFSDAGDEVGWARTRIGKVFIAVELGRVSQALADGALARDVLRNNSMLEKVLALDLNVGGVYNALGDQNRALQTYTTALELAVSLGERGQFWLGPLYTNMGNTYCLLGDFRQAIHCHEEALRLGIEREDDNTIATSKLNLAYVFQSQGLYKKSLALLYDVNNRIKAENLDSDAAYVDQDIVECYLKMNRFAEARDLSQATAQVHKQNGALHQAAVSLLHKATAEALLGNLDGAQETLAQAEAIFEARHAHSWIAIVRIHRGKIALRQGDLATAEREAHTAEMILASNGQQVNRMTARLLSGQTHLAANRLDHAAAAGACVLSEARRRNVPMLRYNGHLLLGRVAEACGNHARARRHYMAAVTTVEYVQRDLTITLRAGFLEDKLEALHALIRLYLHPQRVDKAFETLERSKSQALLSYVANHESLRWPDVHPEVSALVAQLNRLREEHHWFYRLAHDRPRCEEELPSAVSPEQARAALADCEKRLRATSEQLHLYSDGLGRAEPPRLHEVQAALDDDALVIEFYNDGTALWAFTLGRRDIQVQRLAAMPAEIDQLIQQLQRNIDFALAGGPGAATTPRLTRLAQRILERLYSALLAPVEARLIGRRRIVVVPYGALHYLPFHLLYSDGMHLIERLEVVVLPTAGLLTRPGFSRPAGARVFAHSWEGRLPLTHGEAQIVQKFFGSRTYVEAQARRDGLGGAPEQILHIAAHGQHRLDQPDLSFIQLADGQLYTDDLLQHDLSYELVVLSACETGRANVTAGDELIGLGRGILYAGAGALVASLWRVADATTLELMEQLYRHLRAGASKAAALRAAQLTLIAEHPEMHPAFWGAFQLVGDPRPLSGCADDAQLDTKLQHLAEYA
jgi:CHAT domain-containing protein